MNCSDFLLSLNIFLSFCVSSSKHNIILLLKYTCVEFISIKRLWENQIKKLEKHKYHSFRKKISTSHKGIGGRKKKSKVKVKPPYWYFLIIWKISNNIEAVKTGHTLKSLCYWRSQILELLHSILKILSFWNKFWIILCLLW